MNDRVSEVDSIDCGRPTGRPATRRFSWRETLFSERGTLIAIGLGYLLLWVKARV